MIKDTYRKNAGRVILSLVPLVIFGVMSPLRACVIQVLVDSDNIGELLEKCPIVVAFSLGVLLFEWLSRSRQTIVAGDMEMDLRNRLIHRLFSISEGQFEKKSLDYYLSKFAAGIRMILEDGVNNLYDMILQAVYVITAVIYLLCTEPLLLPVVAVAGAGQFAASCILKRKACFTEERYARALEDYLHGVRSVLGGRKVLRAFDAVKQVLVRQENLNDYICREKESASRTLYGLKALASFVGNGALLIVLWSSMFFAVTGRITMGELAAVIYSMSFVFKPCRKIADGILRLKALEKETAEMESLLTGESNEQANPVSYPQTYMFKDTVFNNVALYQNYSRDQVIEALREAGVYDTIRKLPMGVDQEISEGGKNFSEAELQGIALARLLLRKKGALAK